MKKILVIALLFFTGSAVYAQQFHDSFIDNFSDSSSSQFHHRTSGIGADFTWEIGAESASNPGKKILSLKIDPEDEAGAGRGPNMASNDMTYFGTYSARIKVPDVTDIQPDVGAVVGYFTYNNDSEYGLSEIDFEWLIADPGIIYIGTWTGHSGDLKRIGRTINLAEGTIYTTAYKERRSGIKTPLTGDQNQPEKIPALAGYDASSQFYTYGFDWYPDRIRWWLLHPETGEKIILWDYQGSQQGIPQHETRYMINFWHTDDWSVETNRNSIEKPIHPYEVEIDWMSYDPIN